ncbi:S9 family peptidase [Methylobacterium sp. DM1]|nr:S9 family peptidase [Methylobacterium sp. DM1]
MFHPETRRVDVIEQHFGRSVADPYRWLESDARSDPEVADWITAQNAATEAHLRTLPAREAFRARLRILFDHERVTIPLRKGGRYFYTRNAGLENQAVLRVREGGRDRAFVDPNRWPGDGTTALAEWAVSEDGARVAYAVQEHGSDWRTIHVLDVGTGERLADEVRWARFTNIAWAKDGSGFFYARYPEPRANAAFQAGLTGHALHFHRLGTPQADDRLVHATPDRPELLHQFELTEDGRYALLYSTPGLFGRSLAVVDLGGEDWRPRFLVESFDDEWHLVGSIGTRLLLLTTRGADRRRIVALDLAEADPSLEEVVGEDAAIVNDAKLLGGRLLVAYLVDARAEVRRFRPDGSPDGVVELPGLGTAGGFRGDPEDPEAFFAFTSFDAPTTIYRYDVATGARTVWAEPKAAGDLGRIAVEQRFCRSKDGTRVPIFVVRRTDTAQPAPTLLYAYGGFGISMAPFYSPAWTAWVEQGGVVAVANVRGGGEYGRAWHEAGRRERKQTVFDDVIATAEHLIAEGVTLADGLAIQGESHGGLLVGAVVNQRPELFAAALPGVGVMDMLRFDRFTGGQLWVGEFGSPRDEAGFLTLRAYSPYHTIAEGKRYPAILATSADTDDRVVPLHTFKYVAALQAAKIGPRPRLVRVETRAGHGMGKPIDKTIEEVADLWAFAARWTGLGAGQMTGEV